MSRTVDKIISNFRKEVIHTLHPLDTFFIEINSTCNLNCRHCYIPLEQKQLVLPYKDISNVLNEVSKTWGNSLGIAITGGEPLLHANFENIGTLLKKYKFHWSLATNGLLLTPGIVESIKEKGCNAITISLDGNKETHDTQRGKKGTFEKVLKKTELLIEKKFPNIYLTATIHDGNIHSLKDIGRLIKKYGSNINWRLNPLLYCDNVEKNKLKISKDTFVQLCEFVINIKKEVNTKILLGEKNPLSLKYNECLYSEFDSCFAGISTFGVLSNGDIVNCMVCREQVLGNVKEPHSLTEIWKNQNLEKKGLCKRHLESKNSIYKGKKNIYV